MRVERPLCFFELLAEDKPRRIFFSTAFHWHSCPCPNLYAASQFQTETVANQLLSSTTNLELGYRILQGLGEKAANEFTTSQHRLERPIRFSYFR